jgi:hypothetical protein
MQLNLHNLGCRFYQNGARLNHPASIHEAGLRRTSQGRILMPVMWMNLDSRGFRSWEVFEYNESLQGWVKATGTGWFESALNASAKIRRM